MVPSSSTTMLLKYLFVALLCRPTHPQKHHGAHGGGGIGGGGGGGMGFVRPVDEGLVYGAIHAYKEEWNRTFRPYETHIHGVRDLDTPSPFHFFFRCVDGVARMYFTVEDLHARPINNQPQGSEVKMPLVLFKERIKLHVDRVQTEYNLWHGGADVQVDVSDKPRRSYLRVQINDWAQYTAFPLSRCVRGRGARQRQGRQSLFSGSFIFNGSETVRSTLHLPSDGPWVRPLAVQQATPPHSPHYAHNEIIVHVHTFDQFIGTPQPQNTYLIEGLAKHMVYHRCALNVTRYEVVIQDDHLDQYMANKHLAQFAREGWLVFLIKGHRPARLYYSNCNWQGLYENMALLRYWKTRRHVMFWNADEYLVYNQSFTTQSFRAHMVRHAANGFRRYVSFCAKGQCPEGVPEVSMFSLTKKTYDVGEKLRDLKLILNPDFVGCMIMHWAGCGTGLGEESKLVYRSVDQVHMIKNTTAYIAHFENFFHPRWSRTNYAQMWQFAKLDRTIDKVAFPVVARCDPATIHPFEAYQPVSGFGPRRQLT